MVVQALSFYLFAAVAIFSGVMVIWSRNPVHSVLYLILAFFNSAALFVLMGAEFLAMILLIVYVGAVAVLFLFVVMMLDINFVELRKGALRYLPIGATIGLILLAELIILVGGQVIEVDPAGALHAIPDPEQVTNTDALGRLLYTDYIYIFQAAGMILLVAMIGAIVLTHRVRAGVRKQKIGRQVGRTRAEAVQLKKVEPGQGL